MNSTIEQAIVAQNPHWLGQTYKHEFLRTHDKEVISDLDLEEIQVITGIRRCGKSTLMQVVINHLTKTVDPKKILYINFDDPNYIELYQNAAALYDLVTLAEKTTSQTVDYLFLDEIQNIVAWEQYVKSVYDNKRFKKIFVTGSNADLLNSNYASLLSGRYIETRLYPLSFTECLLNKNIKTRLDLIKSQSVVLNLVSEMMHYGSFPRTLKVEESKKLKILKSYYETILLKDCIQNNNIRDSKSLIALAHYLLTNISSRYSFNSLAKAIGNNENTSKQFIHFLENAHLINEVNQFSYSLKQQNKAKKKAYSLDNGLISASTFKYSNNHGKLLENLVYTELCKLDYSPIHYFNDNKECDFIASKHNELTAIQVCYELNDQNRTREINGLLHAMQLFSIKKGRIITYNQEESLQQEIEVIPFWKYFFINT